MKNLFLFFALITSTILFGQTQSEKIYYAVQIMSTENPHLIKPDMVPNDTAMIDLVVINNRMRSRIVYVYETKQEQIISHQTYLKQYPDALLITMTEKQIKGLRKLFTYN